MTRLQANANAYLKDVETRVTMYTALGKDTAEMAEITGISQRNVKYHRQNATHKIGGNNTAHLVALAFQYGILEYLSITLMMFAVGTTLVIDDADIRSQRGRVRTTRTVRVTRTRNRQRDYLESNDLIATV